MHIGVITLFPEMFATLHCGGIVARALERKLLQLSLWNVRDYSQDKYRRVDDRPYGGGAGMVMQVQPLRDCIQAARKQFQSQPKVIYLSPQGRCLDQAGVQALSQQKHLLFISGRYEGIDERILQHDIDEEWSIGDYVLSGGELAAMVMIDVLTRHIPGALGHENSAVEDSFYQGLLDYPHYTRPEVIDEQAVPNVLLTGHHQAIENWRRKQALGRTWQKRPDLLEKLELTLDQQALLDEFINELKGV
jgi:tRNA (guanine37-N1)-methyltransferase